LAFSFRFFYEVASTVENAEQKTRVRNFLNFLPIVKPVSKKANDGGQKFYLFPGSRQGSVKGRLAVIFITVIWPGLSRIHRVSCAKMKGDADRHPSFWHLFERMDR